MLASLKEDTRVDVLFTFSLNTCALCLRYLFISYLLRIQKLYFGKSTNTTMKKVHKYYEKTVKNIQNSVIAAVGADFN